jgi:hypothetical protein
LRENLWWIAYKRCRYRNTCKKIAQYSYPIS